MKFSPPNNSLAPVYSRPSPTTRAGISGKSCFLSRNTWQVSWAEIPWFVAQAAVRRAIDIPEDAPLRRFDIHDESK